jgi:hypothetical protein
MSINSVISSILYSGLVTVSTAEKALGLEAPAKKLTEEQIIELKKVFLSSVDYSKVLVKAGNSHLLTISGRAFVMGNTIYMPKENYSLGLLVHEMTHVWQHQNGGYGYIGSSLVGQYLGEGYDFVKGISGGKSWAKLNPEQQASLIEYAYVNRFFSTGEKEFIYWGRDYTNYLKQALAELRNGKGAPQ